MKRTLTLILALVMALSLAACGGSGGSGDSGGSTPPPSAAGDSGSGGGGDLTSPVRLTFAAQEVGTGAYSVATAIQTAMMKGLPSGSSIDLTTNSPGGVGAPVLIQNDDCDIIVANAGPSQWSYERSSSEYDFGDCPDITALVGGLGHTFTNVMFTQKFVDATGLTTLEEVIEAKYPIRLITKTNGTLGELTAERVIEACGITVDDFTSFASWEKTGADAIKSGLQDGLYDMTIDHVEAGQAATSELCLTTDMHFVQLSDATLANMEKMGYSSVTVEPNTWNGQTEAIDSMGSQQNILVNANMSEDLAYALTKAVCENKDILADAVASMSYFDPATAGLASYTGCPLHPGAIRYFKEAGLPYDG